MNQQKYKQKCNGQFCMLRKCLVSKGLLLLSSVATATNESHHRHRSKRQNSIKYHQFVLEREVRKRNERDGALVLLQKVLHPKEFSALEEDGHLSSFYLNLNRVSILKCVKVERRCLELAKQEHRLDFCRAITEEGDDDDTSSDFHFINDDGYVGDCNDIHEEQEKDTHAYVCGVCAEIYRFLEQLRSCLEMNSIDPSLSLIDTSHTPKQVKANNNRPKQQCYKKSAIKSKNDKENMIDMMEDKLTGMESLLRNKDDEEIISTSPKEVPTAQDIVEKNTDISSRRVLIYGKEKVSSSDSLCVGLIMVYSSLFFFCESINKEFCSLDKTHSRF